MKSPPNIDRVVVEPPPLRTETAWISTNGKEKIEVVLKIPSGYPSGTRFPLLAVFGGFEDQKTVLDALFLDEATILATFDYPYSGNRILSFSGALSHARSLRYALKETQATIRRLVAFVKAREDVDPLRIGLVGASFGTPFALHGAARMPEITVLVIIHGFGDVRGTLRFRLRESWKNKLGPFTDWLARPAAVLVQTLLAPPSPERDAALLSRTQSVLVIEAVQDQFVPLASREALWKAIAASPARSERILMPGKHVRPGANEQIRAIAGLVFAWLHEIGWPKMP